MRALRILLIVVVILGGLFVIADRVAVYFAENEAADKVKTTENLASTPDVSIKGFPFLTQVAAGKLDDVRIGIKDYEADTGDTTAGAPKSIRIDDLQADMKGVTFTGDYSSATASTATGTATIAYDELLKAAKSQPTQIIPGVNAQVVGLSDGGSGKIKVDVKVTAAGASQTYPVLSTVTVDGDSVKVHADNLPKLVVDLADARIRSITDFQQTIDRLPGGVKVDGVQAAKNGVEITVKGSNVKLAG
ncbi:LmeA family phospholipid-binding protein [Streptomyces sp. NPDC002144]|uniref:LmeA family phospholipid-binding protein n=1 Tax=Streptomyces sp. NPDC006668 TaxID=3156903 RepID=UPI0033D59255